MKRSALLLGAMFVLVVGAVAGACSSPPPAAEPQIVEVTREVVREVETQVEVVQTVVVQEEVVKEVEKIVQVEVPVEKVVEVQKIVEREVIISNYNESPDLASQVESGDLPPVHQRLPSHACRNDSQKF